MNRFYRIIGLVFVLTLISQGQGNNARKQLLEGVGKIGAPTGTASHWLVCGKNSFGVAHDGSGAPLIAAAQVGKGRIVFLPGLAWLPSAANAQIGDMERFYENVVQWCGVKKSMKAISNVPESVDWLEGRGIQVAQSGNPGQFKAGLEDARLVVFELNSRLIPLWSEILDIARKGGCVVLSSSIWTPEDLQNLNTQGSVTGIYFTGQRSWMKDIRGWERNGWFKVTPSTDAANLINFKQAGKLNAKARKELVTAVELLGEAKGANEVRQQLYPVVKSRLISLNPSPDNPISDPMEKALLRFESSYIKDAPTLHSVPHRTALPVGKAPRVSREVKIFRIQKQVDTGLYALPGVPVKLTMPVELVGRKITLKISHLRTDLKDAEFLMMPSQIFKRTIDATTVELANPYGGLVMLEFPRDFKAEPFTLKIENAVEAPRFILGKHTDEEWVKTIRNRPTPFGILETENVIFIVHSPWLRTLDDPTRVLELWSELMGLEGEFYNYPGDILRVHHDFQPAGGFSTFPQSYEVSMDLFNYRNLITSGAPLTVHEHGHHGATGFMNFDGLSEASANLGGLYAMANGMEFQWKGSHKPIDRISTFHSLPTDMNMWTSGSHNHNQQRYTTFASLGHYWGFGILRNVVHKLREANGNGGKDSQLVADNWLRFYSEETGADLSNFLELWHLSFSDAAKADVAKFPKWQLIELVEDRVICRAGEAINLFRPHLNDFSYDGILKPGQLTRPENGTLSKVDDTWITYRPVDGFTGTDSFDYEVSNGFGNSYTGTVAIRVLADGDFPKIEFGSVQATSESWQKITPKQAFKSPVLAVFPVLTSDAELAGVDVQTSGGTFKVKPFFMQGDKRLSARIDYILVEEGCYTEARNGFKLEAVKREVGLDAEGVCMTPRLDYEQELMDFYRDPITFGSVVGGPENDGRFVGVHHLRGAQYQVGIVPAPKDKGMVHQVTLDSFASMQIGRHAIHTDRCSLAVDAEVLSPYPINYLFVVDYAISNRGETTLLTAAEKGAAHGNARMLKTSNGLYPADKGNKKPRPFKTHAMKVYKIPSS